MPAMNSKMVTKVQLCTICHKEDCCKTTFRDIALALRFEYILNEYTTLSDAWRVYQGVALYREYRGIGGETKQLDVEPRPCQLCLVKIVQMAQSIYVVTSTVETGVATAREAVEQNNSEAVLNPPGLSPVQQISPKSRVTSTQPGSIGAKERWSTDSKDRWATKPTTPVKKQSGGQVNGHSAASKTPVNQKVNKTPTKTLVNKNRRESPMAKSKEGSALNSSENSLPKQVDTQSSLSVTKDSQTLALSRPRRSVGRSLMDRNPDFQMDTSVRGEVSETDSMEGVANTSVDYASEKKVKKEINPPTNSGDKNVDSNPVDLAGEALADIPVNKTPSLSESRPKRSGGRSLFERNPDFALDIPFAKVVEQNWKAKNMVLQASPCEPVLGVVSKKAKLSQKENVETEDLKSKKNKLVPNKKHEIELEKPVLVKTEIEDTNGDVEVIEVWKSEVFRSEHLAKLDHALSSAGWSQAIRSGKNMEKEVFKNSKTEAEYVAGINRLVAHFNRGNSAVKISVAKEATSDNPVETKSSVQQQQLTSVKIIKPGNEKLKTSISKMQDSAGTVPVLKEKRVVKPSKKILEKKLNAESLKGVKKVAKTWSRTKVNCPMCGQPQLKTKLKDHMLAFHKSSSQFPCSDCEFKSTTKNELENHIKTVHQILNHEGSVSESEESVSSQSVTSSTDSRGRANAVRSQFQYIVKTSKSGKQGRKYIEVAAGPGDISSSNSSVVPDQVTSKSELKSAIVQKPKVKKTPAARKVTTPGSKVTSDNKQATAKTIVSAEVERQSEVIKYMKEDEIRHEAAVSEKVVDEFAGSSSESEFSEPQNHIVGTLNAYYLNKNSQEEDEEDDVSGLTIDSVASVASGTPTKDRPQRRKRSIEDRHPDFVMELPKSAQKSDKNSVKKGKQEIEISNFAKNWFEVNEGDEF